MSENSKAIMEQLLLLGTALHAEPRIQIILSLIDGGPKTMSQVAEDTDLHIGSLSHNAHVLQATGVVTIDAMGRERLIGLRPGWELLVAALVRGLEALVGEGEKE
jgi:DNA-binding transcriptional ArsR family regulator